MKVHDLTEVNVEVALEETFTTTTILTEKRNAENQPISVCCQCYQQLEHQNFRGPECLRLTDLLIKNGLTIGLR